MSVFDFHLEYESIEKYLSLIDHNVAKKIQRQAMRTAGKILLQEAKALAPVRTGFAKKQIKVRAGRKRRNTATIVVGTREGDYKGKAFYLSFVVFGAIKMRRVWEGEGENRKKVKKVVGELEANNFFQRAFDNKKPQVKAKIIAELKHLIRNS